MNARAPDGYLSEMRRLACGLLLFVLSSCRCARDDHEPKRETEARTVLEGTRGDGARPIGPDEAKIVRAAQLAANDVPPPELQGCDLCEGEEATARHCTACRNGERCVQSLLDPAWAALADDAGEDVFLYQHDADAGGALSWTFQFRRDEGHRSLEPLLARQRTFPPDLERYLTLLGACPPVGETIPQSVAAYFEGAFEGRRPTLISVRTSATDPAHARAAVRTIGGEGVVYLRHDGESCGGWRVMLFGFEGCPAFPSTWPEDLR